MVELADLENTATQGNIYAAFDACCSAAVDQIITTSKDHEKD